MSENSSDKHETDVMDAPTIPRVFVPTSMDELNGTIENHNSVILPPSQPLPPKDLSKISLASIGDTKKVTVFVGKINSRINNDFLQKLLEICGKVENWRRMKDPNNNVFKTFGFCDYSCADDALRAIRNLHGLDINGDKLVVKMDVSLNSWVNEFKIKKMLLLFSENLGQYELQIANDAILARAREEEFQREKYEDGKIRALIMQSFIEEQNSETKLETVQTESEVAAVKSTMERLYSEITKEEMTRKKLLITESLRRFHMVAKNKELERMDLEKERSERKEREKKEHSDRESFREKERFRILDDEEDRSRRRRDKELRILEQKEREREEKIRRKVYDEKEGVRTKKKYIGPQIKTSKRDYIDISDDEVEPVEPVIPLEKIEIQLDARKEEEDLEMKNEILKELFKPEEEEADSSHMRKKVTTIDFDEIRREQNLEQKLDPKNIISMIPSNIKELFAMTVNWDVVDQYKIVDELKDFVNKKIKEIFGAEDAMIVEFVTTNLSLHLSATDLVAELSFLENEAETFVAKLWRMLVFKMKRKEIELGKQSSNGAF